MEDMLIVIIQVFFEGILQSLTFMPFDWGSRNRTTPESASIYGQRILWFIGGCVVALISLLIIPFTLIQTAPLRMVNIILAPTASAFLSESIAKDRSQANGYIVPQNHFWQAFYFTFGLVIVRFAYATRF